MCKKWGTGAAHYCYIPAVVARALFSIAMAMRIVGMIYQYSTGNIRNECLQVTDAGRLIQTPFAAECLNLADWVIVVLVPIVLLLMLPAALYGSYKCRKYMND